MVQRHYTGRLGDLSAEQQTALDTLREELRSIEHLEEDRYTDATLLRFLRARKFGVECAKQMLLEAEQWRKKIEIEKIVREFDFIENVNLQKYFPNFYHGTDKDGRPLYILQFGKLDIRAMQKITTPERLVKNFIKEFEKTLQYRFPACSAKSGRHIDSTCAIFDLKHASLSSFYKLKELAFAIMTIGHLYYPECMGKVYVINAPYLFTAVWAVVKSWLDDTTIAKVDILGKDYLEVIAKQVPLESLPNELGGLCECPGGCFLSNKGPWDDDTSKRGSEEKSIDVQGILLSTT